MTETIMNNLIMSIDAVAQELNKLTQEVIKLNERIEDATCTGRRES